MVKLPKVKKLIGSGLTAAERVKKVVLAASLATGVVIGATTAQAVPTTGPAQPAIQELQNSQSGALLLRPAIAAQGNVTVAQHWSHQSHQSHFSHQSHQSHYSSSY